MTKKQLIVWFCLALAVPLLPAAEPADVWTLEMCLNEAAVHNRSLTQARNAVESALAGGHIAESQVYAPTLTASQAFTEDNDYGSSRLEATWLSPLGVEVVPYLTADSNNNSSTPRENSVGITLRRRLFSANERWRLRLPLTQAERQLLQATNVLQREVRELSYDVSSAFLAVQRVQNRLKVRGDRVTDAREFLKITEERVANGLAPKVDIVNAKINLNQAEADLLGEQANVQARTEALLNIMGRPIEEIVNISPLTLAADATMPDLAADSADLRDRHETLVNQRLDMSFAEIEMRIQQDKLRPRFDLAFTGEHRTADDDFLGSRDASAEPVRLEIIYSTTLDGKKQDRARLVQLELAQQDRQLNLIEQENRLLLRLREAHRSIIRLRERVKLDEQRLEAERSKLTATVVRYEDGNVDNLEVTRAKQSVDSAEINLIDTRIDLVLGLAEYRSLLPPAADVKTTFEAP